MRLARKGRWDLRLSSIKSIYGQSCPGDHSGVVVLQQSESEGHSKHGKRHGRLFRRVEVRATGKKLSLSRAFHSNL